MADIGKTITVKFRRRMQNPFLLVGQGFVAGALLFFALLHQDGEARSVQSIGSQATSEAAALRS